MQKLTQQISENESWDVANEQIQALQDIIKDANKKLGAQERELQKERKRGDDLERKIQSAELQLDVIERVEVENKEQARLSAEKFFKNFVRYFTIS